MRLLFLFGSLLVAATTVAQIQKASDVADFVSVDTSVFVLDHVRVVDGTGAPAKEDQAIVISNGKVQSIGPAASAQIPQGAQRIERSGYTVIPGLVGMHNPLYYTDSYSLQVVGGKIGQPGCIWQTYLPPFAIASFVQGGAARRMACCLAWSRLRACGQVVCSPKERPRDSTRSSAIATQSE